MTVIEEQARASFGDCDVVVVGAGGAGLSAAVAAAEAGAKVVVLEQLGGLRGTTSYSVGSFAAADTRLQRKAGIADSAADFAEDISLTHPLANKPDGLRIMLARESGPTLAWLEDLGMVFVGPYPEPPNRVPRMHNAVPNGRAYLDVLSAAARRHGVDVLYGSRVVDLVMDKDRVAGVVFESGGRRREIRAARGVVLASGDFTGSQEMRDMHLSPTAAKAVPINTRNKGDGHRMAATLGAEMRNLDVIFGPQLRLPPDGRVSWIDHLPAWRWTRLACAAILTRFPALLGPLVRGLMIANMSPSAEMFDEGAVLVSSQGELMGADNGSRIDDLADTPDGNGYVLGDRRLADRFSAYPYFISTAPGIAYAYFKHYEKARPDLLRWFDDLAGMARHYRMNEAALVRATVGLTAPYFAFGPFKAMVTVTEGGAATDATMRVLDLSGKPIAGLFAAGGVGQGGLRLKGHGLHIGWAMVSGRVAGQVVAGARALAAPGNGRTDSAVSNRPAKAATGSVL